MSVQGTWELTITRPDATVHATLDLTVQGTVVTGRSTRSDGLSTDILDGGLDGQNLTFDIDITVPVAARLHFELVVSDDTLAGIFTSEQIGSGQVTGKHV